MDLYGTKIETPDLATEAGSGTVNTDVSTTVVNDSDTEQSVSLRHTVFPKGADAEASIGTATTTAVNVPAGTSQEIDADVAVKGAELWSTENPNLYTVRTEVLVNGEVTDTYDTDYGFRYFDFNADTGFSLNGKNVKLKGVCMHHDQGSLGAEAWERAIERQVEILKEMGCNSIRVTHNPASDELIEICNEQGILVIDEAFDGWAWPKNGNSKDYARFFEQSVGKGNELIGAEADMTWAEFDLKAMVKRGMNAPSIIMWSLGNEVSEGTSEGLGDASKNIQTKLINWGKEVDKTRPYTRGDNNIKNGTDGGAVVDMLQQFADTGGTAGLNYCDGGLYDKLHSQYQGWKLYGSETASSINSRGVYDRLGNGNEETPSDKKLTSYDNQRVGWGALASAAWYDVIKRDFVAGEYVWTGFDYIGEPTPWNGIGVEVKGTWPSRRTPTSESWTQQDLPKTPTTSTRASGTIR